MIDLEVDAPTSFTSASFWCSVRYLVGSPLVLRERGCDDDFCFVLKSCFFRPRRDFHFQILESFFFIDDTGDWDILVYVLSMSVCRNRRCCRNIG